MSRPYIADAVRLAVVNSAGHRCGYCQTQIRVVGTPMTLDHIIPIAEGGTDDESNLWLACSWCNSHKAARTQVPDPETGIDTPLFNPRQQQWHEHFAWTADGLTIVGVSAVGRATVEALQVNNIYIVKSRMLWVTAGWHPPRD